MRSTTILLALLAAGPASAISPETPIPTGIEPQRVFRVNPQVQARLASQPAWRAFVAEAPGWRARFDEVTGAPLRMWGGGITLPTDSEDALVAALTALLDRHAQLLRFQEGTLVARRVGYAPSTDTWYVDLDAPRDGVRTWRGGITARIKQGRLISIGALAYGDRPTEGAWNLAADAAIAHALAGGPAPGAAHTDVEAERSWVPVEDARGLRLEPTWIVRSRTSSPPGRWVTFVRADDGTVLGAYNEVRLVDGTVMGWHQERTLDGSPPVLSPLPEVYVSDGVDVAITDDAGAFSIPGADLTTDLNGQYVEVRNDTGPEGTLVTSDPDIVWTTANATQAEISSYRFVHDVRAWGLRVAPDNDWVQGPVRSHVNVTDYTCNAYWDGELHFFAAGGGCGNTGEIADVNYHEWGHGFHFYSLESYWVGFDGSLSEGAADTTSFLLTGDSRIAPYFFGNGGSIRDVSPNRRYPDDYVASEYYVHSNGLIFGGAMWDLWGILKGELGEAEGTAATEQIFAGLLKGGPDIASSYDEAVVADDDDGDLSNGTPHQCAIIDAFALHGLGPLATGGSYVATFAPDAVHETPELPFPIAVGIDSAAPACLSVQPTSGTLHYSVDGGAWETATLSIGANDATGEIPAQVAGSVVSYWLEVDDADGSTFTLPSGGEINAYSVYVGPVLDVWCTDFEADDGRFKHELLQGDEGDGADDWQWGAPQGVGGDPASAWSGDMVWGNDLGWDGYNGQYQDDKKNRLTSPAIDVAHHLGTFLSYRRWLTIEDAVFDQAKISADDDVVWTNAKGMAGAGGKDHLDADWAPHVVPLDGAGDDGSVTLSWTLNSDGNGIQGGWTLDDVCVLAPDTPDNRLGISGIAAERNPGGVTLAWRNPIYEGANSLTVVRNDAHLPAHVGDGVVVWATNTVDIGAPVQAIDDRAPEYDAYYAVFAANDTNVLSWSRDGFNAIAVPGIGPSPAAVEGDGVGCGCATGTGAPPWTLAVAGLLLIVRRRR